MNILNIKKSESNGVYVHTKNKKKGFSLVELIVVIAIMAVFLAVLAPQLLRYVENSRVQKDVSTMDEVVNAVELTLSDEEGFDEMFRYSCDNNYITYSDSSGIYGQKVNDNEYWAPDGSGKATTITFNPTKKGIKTTYEISEAIVNDITYGNGSVGQEREVKGSEITDNQCYLTETTYKDNDADITAYVYNRIRQAIGDKISITSQTYGNSSYTIFIVWKLKDGIWVPNVHGDFNGTNLTIDSVASKGSGTSDYTFDEDNNQVANTTTSGTTNAMFTNSSMSGPGSLNISDSQVGGLSHNKFVRGEYYVGVSDVKLGDYDTAKKEYIDGDAFPTPKTGDIYVYGDYEYRYNMKYGTTIQWHEDESINGWSVRVLNTNKEYYGELLTTINNAPVKSLYLTFYRCLEMKRSPKIPTTVENFKHTFYQCLELQKGPDLSLNKNVTSLYGTFKECTKMEEVEGLPPNLIDLELTFESCRKLKKIELPNSVRYIKNSAFLNCTSLTSFTIPSNVKTTGVCSFFGCSNLKVINIPKTVTVIENQLLKNCSSLSDINYSGSKSQWETITFKENWNEDCPSITIHCTDGNISI